MREGRREVAVEQNSTNFHARHQRNLSYGLRAGTRQYIYVQAVNRPEETSRRRTQEYTNTRIHENAYKNAYKTAHEKTSTQEHENTKTHTSQVRLISSHLVSFRISSPSRLVSFRVVFNSRFCFDGVWDCTTRLRHEYGASTLHNTRDGTAGTALDWTIIHNNTHTLQHNTTQYNTHNPIQRNTTPQHIHKSIHLHIQIRIH